MGVGREQASGGQGPDRNGGACMYGVWNKQGGGMTRHPLLYTTEEVL